MKLDGLKMNSFSLFIFWEREALHLIPLFYIGLGKHCISGYCLTYYNGMGQSEMG